MHLNPRTNLYMYISDCSQKYMNEVPIRDQKMIEDTNRAEQLSKLGFLPIQTHTF